MGINAGSAMIGLQAAGTVMGASGAYTQASAEKGSLQYDAQVATQNAALAEQEAQQAIIVGQTEEQNVRLKSSQEAATQKADLAANGVALNSGSAEDILATSKYIGERNALTIRDNASREAWGFNVEANNYRNNAAALDASAKGINPGEAALGTLMGGAGQVASSWYKLKQQS